jgi:hypothetical protein
MDAIRTRSERRLPGGDIVVLPDGEDRTAGRVGHGDGGQTVVRAGGQVDDDPVDIRQGGLESRRRPDGSRLRARATHEVGEARGPDQVVGEDGDARSQARPSARW